MTDEDVCCDEPTLIMRRKPRPREQDAAPLPLLKRVAPQPPPPPRRLVLPPPASPSLAEAAPTRPGRLAFTNDALFVVTGEHDPRHRAELELTRRMVPPPLPPPRNDAEPCTPAESSDDVHQSSGDSASIIPAAVPIRPAARKPQDAGRGRGLTFASLGLAAALGLGAVGLAKHLMATPDPGPELASASLGELVDVAAPAAADVTIGVQGVDRATPASAAAKRSPRKRRAKAASQATGELDAEALSDLSPDLFTEDAAGEEAPADDGGQGLEELADALDGAAVGLESSDEAPAQTPSASERSDGDSSGPPPFDRGAAKAALGAAAGRAMGCADGTIRGSARVAVTFAKSGRATIAVLDGGSALAGTSVGSCVARQMRSATIPAYSGGVVTVRTTVRIRK